MAAGGHQNLTYNMQAEMGPRFLPISLGCNREIDRI
jgi:hypothetical protein